MRTSSAEDGLDQVAESGVSQLVLRDLGGGVGQRDYAEPGAAQLAYRGRDVGMGGQPAQPFSQLTLVITGDGTAVSSRGRLQARCRDLTEGAVGASRGQRQRAVDYQAELFRPHLGRAGDLREEPIEDGLILQRDAGNGTFVRLRREEFEQRSPGLLDTVIRLKQAR
jgi:hypothetical protein